MKPKRIKAVIMPKNREKCENCLCHGVCKFESLRIYEMNLHPFAEVKYQKYMPSAIQHISVRINVNIH